MRWLLLILIFLLASCGVSATAPRTETSAVTAINTQSATFGAVDFVAVVRAVQPIATRECRRRTRGINCNFLVQLDPNRKAPPNAFQGVTKDGRPVLTFTASLVNNVRNPDELAFVLGHEAAHHIDGHLARQKQNAIAGAAVFAGLATLTGGSAADVANAQKLGAVVGARSYSKEFELEADELGTLIAYRAGYNPLIGAQYFTTLPDPGNRFLGTHPPNNDRLETVRRTSARLGIAG